MPEAGNKRSTIPPTILIVVAVVILLVGVGRCGLLQPFVRPRMDDYGFGALCCVALGFGLFTAGLIWLIIRRNGS